MLCYSQIIRQRDAPRVALIAMPAGRPTKYDPKFCEVVEEVGSYGGWLSEMAEACDVHRSSMDEWASVHPEFSEALARAKQKAQAWFESVGRTGLTAERFNSALWAKQMSARHRDEYTERRELTGADGGAIKTEETGGAAEKLASLLAGIAERSGNSGESA